MNTSTKPPTPRATIPFQRVVARRHRGAIGALFRITLVSHGYVLVAKATSSTNSSALHHEEYIYGYLQRMQGITVPVCVGGFDLDIPWYYEWLELRRMLLLSYSGRRVRGEEKAEWMEAWGKVEDEGVSHNDWGRRNVLELGGSVMVIDFDRAEVRERLVGEGEEVGVESSVESGLESSVMSSVVSNVVPGEALLPT
ncbi:MAG: hypothetical protein M1840_001265 [Geoglossum simile]|nr:MAG: hypothetical protein M1840_001265 [Geoglossum simile]